MKDYYKTRLEAESVRVFGECIYYVQGKGYYIVKKSQKRNWFEINILGLPTYKNEHSESKR